MIFYLVTIDYIINYLDCQLKNGNHRDRVLETWPHASQGGLYASS